MDTAKTDEIGTISTNLHHLFNLKKKASIAKKQNTFFYKLCFEGGYVPQSWEKSQQCNCKLNMPIYGAQLCSYTINDYVTKQEDKEIDKPDKE